MTWVVFRSVHHRAFYVLRARTVGRWLSPPILCTSIDSARRLTPAGAPLLRFA